MWRRQGPGPGPAEPPVPAPAAAPAPTLYSEYVGRRPPRPRPEDSAGNPLPSYLFSDPLDQQVRNRLALLLERHLPPLVVTDPRFKHISELMAVLAIERLVEVRGDLSVSHNRV